MLDHEARRELTERLGSGVDRIAQDQVPEGVDTAEAAPFIEAIWDAWVQHTFTLIAYGFPQRALCDAAAEMTAMKEQAGDRLVQH